MILLLSITHINTAEEGNGTVTKVYSHNVQHTIKNSRYMGEKKTVMSRKRDRLLIHTIALMYLIKEERLVAARV